MITNKELKEFEKKKKEKEKKKKRKRKRKEYSGKLMKSIF